MRENYNGFNFFVRVFGYKMAVWKEKARNYKACGRQGTPGLYHPSTGLRERKSPATGLCGR